MWKGRLRTHCRDLSLEIRCFSFPIRTAIVPICLNPRVRIRTVTSSFAAYRPKGYRIYSWEAIEPNAWYDPDVVTRSEPQGKPVRIQEMSKETVDVKIIPAPKQ